MILIGRNSDRTGERRWHIACSAFAAALGWLLIVLACRSSTILSLNSRWFLLAGMALTLTGMKSVLTVFWTLPPHLPYRRRGRWGHCSDQFCGKPGRPCGATIMGQMEGTNGDYTVGYLIVVAALLLGGVLVLTVRNRRPGLGNKSEFDAKKYV